MRIEGCSLWRIALGLAVVVLFVTSDTRGADTATVLHVSNAEELYEAVNDSANAGAAVVLAPGTYALTASTAGTLRPNGGRIELQQDMSLYGVTGDRNAVVIDASGLPPSSVTVAGIGKSGAVRLGRGSHSIEWMTVRGNTAAAGAIVADLSSGTPTRIRIAHVLAGFGTRGIDLRNLRPAGKIEAEVVDNELVGDEAAPVASVPEGIRMVNFTGADRGEIEVRMSGNYVHDFQIGCIAANNKAIAGRVSVSSHGDWFISNGLGALIIGGIGGARAVEDSTTMFVAHGSAFVDNTKPITGIPGAPLDIGGIVVLGADTPTANRAFRNTATVQLWGTRVSGNQNVEFEAFGARSTAVPEGIAGTGNTVTIELHGESKKLDVEATDSSPIEPGGTNYVTVVSDAGHFEVAP